jgi:hypothetical protein
MSKALRVVFTEDDTLFRLQEMALLRRLTPQGEKTLNYFFGQDIQPALTRLTSLADRLGLPPDIDTLVCEDEATLDANLGTADMLVVVADTLKHRVSLDSIANATFGLEKTSVGLQAIQWWKEGKMFEIAEYCCYDVKLTKLVHEYGAQNKQLFYKNRFGAKLSVPVAWE